MTLQKRYTLIILGFILFSLAAPFFVLSIRGYVYDFDAGRFIKTGILVAKTKPKGALIELSGPEQVRAKSNKAIRFLTPGDYQIKVSKADFVPWTKTLSVKGGLVSALGYDYLYLLPENLIPLETQTPPAQPEPSQNDEYIFIDNPEQNSVSLARRNSGEEIQLLIDSLPPASDKEIFVTPDGLVFVILDQTLYRVHPEIGQALDIQEGLRFIGNGVEFVNWDTTLKKIVFGNQNELLLLDPFNPEQSTELIERTTESGGGFCFLKDFGYVFRLYGDKLKAVELDDRGHRNSHTYDLGGPAEEIYCHENNKTVSILSNGLWATYRFNFGSVLDLWPG